MSEFKGTKGPWAWSDLSEDDNTLRGAGGRVIFWGDNIASGVQEDDGWAARIGGTHSNDESEANAHLIAAAPDLLLCLQQIVSSAHRLGVVSDDDSGLSLEVSKAEFYIAKALGETK